MDQAENSLEHSALLWLESSGALTTLHRAMTRRSKKRRPPAVLCFLLPIDLTELHQISPELADTVFWEPLMAQQIFQKLVHASCVACALNMETGKGNQDTFSTSVSFEALDQNSNIDEVSNATVTSANFNCANNFDNFDTSIFSANITLESEKEDSVGVPGGIATCGSKGKENEPEFGLSLSDTRDLFFESESLFPEARTSLPQKRKVVQDDSTPQPRPFFDSFSRIFLDEDDIFSQIKPSGNKRTCSENPPLLSRNVSTTFYGGNKSLDYPGCKNVFVRGNKAGGGSTDTVSRPDANDSFDGCDVTGPASHYKSREKENDDCSAKDMDNSRVEAEDLNATLMSLTSHRPIQNEPAHLLTKSQVMVRLRVTGVPPVPPWRVCTAQDTCCPPARHRLGVVIARVVAVTAPPVPYTVWARYKCSSGGGAQRCVGRSRDLHIRHHCPGTAESDTLNSPTSCTVCGSELVEDPSAREIGKQVTVMLQSLPHSEQPTQHCSSYSLQRPLVVTLRDELCSAAVLGSVVQLTVMCVPRLPPLHPAIEAVGAELDILNASRVSSSPNSLADQNKLASAPGATKESNTAHTPAQCSGLPVVMPHLLPLPDVIRELYYDRRGSPWSSVLSLAYLCASSVAPAGTFHTLKLVLLLSLVAAKQGGLSVLSVGNNSSTQLRLLHYMSSAAQHRVQHGYLCNVGPHVVQHSRQSEWVFAGSVVNASEGVCVVGDLSTLNAPSRHALYNILESGSCSAVSRGGNVVLQLPLRTSVWATHEPNSTKRPTPAVAALDSSLINVFSLVVHTDTNDSAAEEPLVLHTLLSATGQPVSDLLCMDHLKQVVEVCSSIQVEMSEAAERLLCGYYVATRAIRGNAVVGASLPVTAMRSMARVSESHARLSMRSSVEEWDVAAAVLLCEEALAASTGYSVLQIQPRPHLPRGVSLDVTIGRKNDEYMAEFLDQLRTLAASKNHNFADTR